MNLLGLMQLWDNEILINDKPKHIFLNPTEAHHCIKIPGSKDKSELRIPLLIKGVISYFPTWKPTIEEYEGTPSDRVLELASENVDWDPQVETRFEEQEDAMLNLARLSRKHICMDATHRIVASLHSHFEHDLPEPTFGIALSEAAISSLSTKDHLNGVRAEDLAKR